MGGILAAHGSDGEEGSSSRLGTLEGEHRRLCRFLILNHDMLKIGGKCRLHGGHILVLYANDLGKGAVNFSAGCTRAVGDPALGIGLHHKTNAVGVALKMLLHCAKGIDPLLCRIALQLECRKTILSVLTHIVFFLQSVMPLGNFPRDFRQ